MAIFISLALGDTPLTPVASPHTSGSFYHVWVVSSYSWSLKLWAPCSGFESMSSTGWSHDGRSLSLLSSVEASQGMRHVRPGRCYFSFQETQLFRFQLPVLNSQQYTQSAAFSYQDQHCVHKLKCRWHAPVTWWRSESHHNLWSQSERHQLLFFVLRGEQPLSRLADLLWWGFSTPQEVQ